MLLFKKRFLPAIREGAKTQTIRMWKYARMRAGQRSYTPGVGYIRITAVEPVRLEDLTDEDARRDGFATATALRDELAQLYPEHQADDCGLYRVVFEVLPPEQQKKR
jgi:hypothetical protein